MRQLDRAIDSIEKQNAQFQSKAGIQVFGGLQFITYLDSSWNKVAQQKPVKNFDQLIPDSIKTTIQQTAAGQLSTLRLNNENILTQFKEKQKDLRLHEIEWHRKVSLSLACIVLFLIGAPLGSIIRKGGIGTPLVVAIVFFMLFYFTSNTGEKMAREGTTTPFMGMWFSTFVLVPIGVFLIYKAMHDSQLFNKEFYHRVWKVVKARVKRQS